MNTNEQENYDSTNEAEETVNNEEDNEEQEEQESIEELREKLAASEKQNKTLLHQKKHLRDKAKAPKEVAPSESKSQGELSSQDIMAIIRSDVPEDDIDDVREYANMKGISIKEALGSNVVKSILGDKAEQRNVASASNTGSSKRTSNTISDEQLVKNAASGKLPESDEDMRRLIRARRK